MANNAMHNLTLLQINILVIIYLEESPCDWSLPVRFLGRTMQCIIWLCFKSTSWLSFNLKKAHVIEVFRWGFYEVSCFFMVSNNTSCNRGLLALAPMSNIALKTIKNLKTWGFEFQWSSRMLDSSKGECLVEWFTFATKWTTVHGYPSFKCIWWLIYL